MRSLLRARRKKLSRAARRKAAAIIAARITRLPAWRCARHIAVYLSSHSELDTAPLLRAIWRSGRIAYVPKLARGGLRFVRLNPRSPLRRNRYGIREPVGPSVLRALARMNLVLLPLLGFDAQRHRLGTGGGYYDRALAFARPWRRPFLVGLAFAVQEVAEIPAEAHDVGLDAIITERTCLIG